MKIGIIGNGAIAQFVHNELIARDHQIEAYLLRPARISEAIQRLGGSLVVSSVKELPTDLDQVIDCAGHQALHQYGPDLLRAGFDVTTVSIGALADRDLYAALERAAQDGVAALRLASGAIGALDALRSANIGTLESVQYTGRKPPQGWLGSPAEIKLDLNAMTSTPRAHFSGTAREAALAYPKNANVAAAVALAGVGFDKTMVALIADPTVTENIHEIKAKGRFGSFEFRIAGKPLPGNPRSSALAAMSVVDRIEQSAASIRF